MAEDKPKKDKRRNVKDGRNVKAKPIYPPMSRKETWEKNKAEQAKRRKKCREDPNRTENQCKTCTFEHLCTQEATLDYIESS